MVVLLFLDWFWVPVDPWVVVAHEIAVIEGWFDCQTLFLSMAVLHTLVTYVIMVWVVWSSQAEAAEVWVEVSELGVILLVKRVVIMMIAVNAVLKSEIVS